MSKSKIKNDDSLTPNMSVEEIGEKLSSRDWRLNNLYWIHDKKGNKVKFSPNWAQEELYDNLWYQNVILKVRQLGVTTFFCVLFLDDTLFGSHDSGLIAHTQDDAKKIFKTKIQFPFNNLPEALKSKIEVTSKTKTQMEFKVGGKQSSIYTGTSLRSGTLQNLHISEMATIDQKYPDKAKEIKSGALNTVHSGVITMESTAKGASGVFADICEKAQQIQKSNKELTELDWEFFFFPWWRHPDYKLDQELRYPDEMREYFEHIEAEVDLELEPEQKAWYYKKKRTQEEDMRREFPSLPEEAFFADIEGAYFGDQMDKAEEEGRITSVPHEDSNPVDTYWDLGISKSRKDSMCIIFCQDVGLEKRIIDFYGASGEGLKHFVNVLQKRREKEDYTYGTHYAPHDIEVKELGTGKSRLELAAQMGLNFEPLPKLPFSDTIEAARLILPRCWFDDEKTDELVKALKSFRKEWDDKRGKFKEKPLKNWASDPADAFRMLAVAADSNKMLSSEEQQEDFQRNQGKNQKSDPLNPLAM